jgi:uncharacterized protein
MRVLMSGTNGMIGSVVAPYLASQGHEVVRLVRREPGPGEVAWDPDRGMVDAGGIEGFDAVVHTASARWPLRWTRKAKSQIRENRLRCNALLSETLAGCAVKPRVLVFASGMGIYPSSGDQVLTEDSPLSTDFLATLQRDGEAAMEPAIAAGIRVVPLRIPAVIGGAAIRQSIGRMGDGRQWSSWVSRDELASIIQHVLVTESVTGPVNPVSPNPERNADYVATLSQVLGKRPGTPIPAFALRLMIGEMADSIILASRRMAPQKLLDTGYRFRFPSLHDALLHELEADGGSRAR